MHAVVIRGIATPSVGASFDWLGPARIDSRRIRFILKELRFGAEEIVAPRDEKAVSSKNPCQEPVKK